ncbi:transglutaminaseTgpA domain-containing protein [Halovivax limisalsi]|uniref:transglutaminase family protein n=1 Tax=Halovivax limisalsi TaxID=1453760 RepID=UPI001FFDB9E0|nr:DUF3488 and transglutaminase-like domain-containing protein [Halovivax limisalsi]
MSSAPGTWTGRARRELALDATDGSVALRVAALCCSLAFAGTVVRVLMEITRFVGGTRTLWAVAVGSVLVGTVAALTIGERLAVGLGVGAAVLGFAYYMEAAGVPAATAMAALELALSDALGLATGVELIRIVEARTWALAYVPVPTFLTWYLALRRRYALATVPAGLALGFLVLTGDASTWLTLVGVLAGLGTVAFGELERHGGTVGQADLLVVLVAVMIVLSLSVSLVPGDAANAGGVPGAGAGTLEGSTATTPERSTITGSVDLSPEVRFTIESDRPAYWRGAVYDRYAGDSWVRTGETRPYDGRLDPPPGDYETITQQVTVETPVRMTPAAASPLAVEGSVSEYLEVTDHGQVRPSITLYEDDQYTVTSAVIDPSPDAMRAAGTDYPDHIETRYLQQPEDVSGEFEARTAEIVGDAATPYDAARAIERHLRGSKNYSLDVERPDGDVASAYLLEMDEGYCVYAATTMVQMLRSEGIPARYATGYTEGQQVGDDTWVVRGLDAHAWPEVYFPDHGWVAFEPTPMDDRDAAHADRLADAREDDESNVDTNESEDVAVPEQPDPPEENETAPEADPGDGDDAPPDDDSDEGFSIPLPTREQLAVTGIGLLGALAGMRHVGAFARLGRLYRLYRQRPGESPAADAERAYERLEYFLAATHRPRAPAESYRAYLEALSESADLDERVHRVAEIRERATFGPGVDRAAADEAIRAVDELVAERRPIRGVGKR